MNSSYIVECRGLTKNYSGVQALRDINLTLGRGKIIGLLGPNGSGKTTLIKLMNGLLEPTFGQVFIDGEKPGPYTKSIVSYLPDRTYFAGWMKVQDIFNLFADFYTDFNMEKARDMCAMLNIEPQHSIKSMSKGTKEKIQLILCMSRDAQLYLLDEPIAGVDPAAREYILSTIINNYNEAGTVLISTHLISEIERVLDEVIFINGGIMTRHDSIDAIKEREGKSIDEVFRDDFRMIPYMQQQGGYRYDI